MIRLRKRVVGLLNRFIELRKSNVEKVNWQGLQLKVYPGTIRQKVDYDDAWYKALTANVHNIIDVGANIGYTALLAFSTGIEKKIILLDPNPDALEIAAGNMFRNGFSSITSFICSFISDEFGNKQKFYTVGSGAAGSMYADHAETAKYSNSFYEVSTETIDHICGENGFKPDLIKIDVEGAEALVLKGSYETVKSHNPMVFVEMHSNPDLSMLENGNKIIQWCREINYKTYYLKEHIELLNSEPIAHRGKCHLLLIHADQNYPDYLKIISQGGSL